MSFAQFFFFYFLKFQIEVVNVNAVQTLNAFNYIKKKIIIAARLKWKWKKVQQRRNVYTIVQYILKHFKKNVNDTVIHKSLPIHILILIKVKGNFKSLSKLKTDASKNSQSLNLPSLFVNLCAQLSQPTVCLHL